jgi:bacteriocin-like protein
MENIMSNSSKTELTTKRELTADELNQIAGGTPSIPIPPPTHHAINYIQVRYPSVT